MEMRGGTLILGIGNLLRKDDGFGIHVINRLKDTDLPEDVTLLDGGTAGIDLVSYLEAVDRLIIVDAVLGGGMPGDIRVLSAGDCSDDYFIPGHYGRLGDILDMAAALWRKPETIVVGAVVKDCESYEIGLTPELETAAEKVAALVSDVVTSGVFELNLGVSIR